jgi:hypothetical protein
MNNEAKVRRSTKSVVLGKAKVMSYEDIKEARIKRAAKDAIKGKGKRSPKRKSIELEADKPSQMSQMSQIHSHKWHVLWKRSYLLGGFVVGSVRVLH